MLQFVFGLREMLLEEQDCVLVEGGGFVQAYQLLIAPVGLARCPVEVIVHLLHLPSPSGLAGHVR